MDKKYLILMIIAGLVFVGGMVFLTYKGSTPKANQDGSTPQKTGLSSLFPFLDSSTTSVPPSTPETQTQSPGVTSEQTSVGPVFLKQISKHSVAGLIALPIDTSVQSAVSHSAKGDTATGVQKNLPKLRYAEKGTGYIYETDSAGENERKISSTILSRTAIAYFGTDGSTVAVRYVKTDNATVGTFLGTVNAPKDPDAGIAGTLVGTFLPDGIIDVAVSPDGKNIGYIVPTENGVVGMSSKMDGTGKKQLFLSQFGEWILDWKTGGLYATTKASAGIPGYMYKVSTTGTFQKVLGNIPGLTTTASPDGKMVLYGVGDSGTTAIHLRKLKDGTDVNTGLSGLPEKCVWASDSSAAYCGVPQYVPSAAYPDSWYQGLTHFTDAIWKIDPVTGVTTKLTTGSEGLIDATNLTLARNNSFLYFVNKTDGTLWSLDLVAAQKT